MEKLTRDAYQEIRTWMHRNARPLDMALWRYEFEGGGNRGIEEALAFYQNEDGGFGNGVEPDCWNQESSPYATLIASGLLRETGLMAGEEGCSPIADGIFRYLGSGVHSDEDGWLFSIPSNDGWPRAPWWTYDREQNKVQGMGITAGLCAFLLCYGEPGSKAYERASGYAGRILRHVADSDQFGEMGIGGIHLLLEGIAKAGLSGAYGCEGVMEKLVEMVSHTIERDPERWTLYTPRPSEFIKSPDSPFYHGNEEIVERELDYLIDTRRPGGVWDITWNWFGLGEQYPKQFAISENWWMASKAMEHVMFLRSFGRVED